MSVEHREYPRLEEEFPVYFDIVPNSVQKPIPRPQRKGVAKNISGGGLYLISSRIRKGIVKRLLGHLGKLSIEFCLPDFQHKISILGEVRWVKGLSAWWNMFPRHWELGVRFIYIQPEDKNSIIKYVINKQIEDHLTKQK